MTDRDSTLAPCPHSTPDEQAKAIEIGRELDAEDGGYPAPAPETARFGWTFCGPDGEWHWSAERDNHESVTDQRPATPAECAFAAEKRDATERAANLVKTMIPPGTVNRSRCIAAIREQQ